MAKYLYNWNNGKEVYNIADKEARETLSKLNDKLEQLNTSKQDVLKADGGLYIENNTLKLSKNLFQEVLVVKNGEYTPSKNYIGFKKVIVDCPSNSTAVDIINGTFNDDQLYSISNDILKVKDYCFKNTSITTVDLPNCVEIGEGAFQNCDLVSLNLPSVTRIGDNAFKGCFNNSELINEIHFPELIELGKNAFSNLPFKKVYFPNLKIIGNNCFSKKTTDVYISTNPNNLIFKGDNPFGGYPVFDIHVPEIYLEEYKTIFSMIEPSIFIGDYD